MLLVLDNFEQVIEAAPELSALLASCPNLSMLVTSRELLRVQGEQEYQIAPLANTEAVELFCARARIGPSESVAELCARLDNQPLAVELAAARVTLLSPEQILERLSQRLDFLQGGRDADPRQQTLRATIEWSHDLLSRPPRKSANEPGSLAVVHSEMRESPLVSLRHRRGRPQAAYSAVDFSLFEEKVRRYELAALPRGAHAVAVVDREDAGCEVWGS